MMITTTTIIIIVSAMNWERIKPCWSSQQIACLDKLLPMKIF